MIYVIFFHHHHPQIYTDTASHILCIDDLEFDFIVNSCFINMNHSHFLAIQIICWWNKSTTLWWAIMYSIFIVYKSSIIIWKFSNIRGWHHSMNGIEIVVIVVWLLKKTFRWYSVSMYEIRWTNTHKLVCSQCVSGID